MCVNVCEYEGVCVRVCVCACACACARILMQTQAYPHEEHCRDMLVLAARLHDITKSVQAHVKSSYTHVTSSYPFSKSPLYASPNQCRHHTYYVTSSYILCHIIIHTMSHHHTYYVTSSPKQCRHPFSKSPLYALLQ